MSTPRKSPAHTTGPWTLNANEVCAQDNHETLIAEVFSENEAWRANARLIAAAPDLLDVMKQVYSEMEDGSINDTGSSIPYFVASVIAKAA